MYDLMILGGVAIVSSCLATLGIARRIGQTEQLTEVERQRIELDALLDELSPKELRDVMRFSRELNDRRDRNESADRSFGAVEATS